MQPDTSLGQQAMLYTNHWKVVELHSMNLTDHMPPEQFDQVRFFRLVCSDVRPKYFNYEMFQGIQMIYYVSN